MIRSESSGIKLLLDQGIPLEAASIFREMGYDCERVSELGMQKAEDEEILTLARHRGCVVITLDADFHSLIAVHGLIGPSVVRLPRRLQRACRG